MRTTNTRATAERWFDPYKHLQKPEILGQISDYFKQTHTELYQKILDYTKKEKFLFGPAADGNPLASLSYFFFTKFLYTDGVLARNNLKTILDVEQEHAKAATINYIMKTVILMVSLMKGCIEKFGDDRSVPRMICTRSEGKTSLIEGQIQLFTPQSKRQQGFAKSWFLKISLDYSFDDFWEEIPLKIYLKCDAKSNTRIFNPIINFYTDDLSSGVKEFSKAIEEFLSI